MAKTLFSHSLPYCADALALFESVEHLPHPVLLHSADRTAPHGRYDICAADPREVFNWRLGDLGDPWQALKSMIDIDAEKTSLPFVSGLIGYFGYGLHQTMEKQIPCPQNPVDIPDCWAGYYPAALVTDHVTKTTQMVSRDLQALGRLNSQIEDCRFAASTSADSAAIERTSIDPLAFSPALSNADYRLRFDKIKTYLLDGDCYQTNFANHYTAQFGGSAWDLYLDRLQQQPAPFGAYLDTHEGQILCFSPERFAHLADGRVQVCPIKGTRPRAEDPTADQGQFIDLQNSAKDQAENLMIVDLLRNDLGKISTIGSVEVTELFATVAYSNVFHLVSTIESTPKKGQHPIDVLQALFPSGSITGAPKIRAIDIINELEPTGRSIYCGSIAYVDASGHTDSNVAIRCMVVKDNQVHTWGGGGIVADSQANSELQEIQDKIGGLLGHRTGQSLRR